MEAMVQFVLPVSHKYLLYVAENADLSLITESKKSLLQEDFTKATKQVETYGYELMEMSEVRQFLKASALNFKRTVQRFLKYQREIQKQVAGLDQFLFERIIPCVGPHKVFDFIKWASTMFKNTSMIAQYENLAKMSSMFGVLNRGCGTRTLLSIKRANLSETGNLSDADKDEDEYEKR
eukprot:TRINITY_DN4377_c0_g6_i1.p3 TRINITY_DN4377_c0_g6~~TRINITY_DN4377_c0_g6_i1.p3  ORF type:complete len:179 (+),score=52.95 TRINITY_DN4377_c0_g6_i1:951-1487(+)